MGPGITVREKCHDISNDSTFFQQLNSQTCDSKKGTRDAKGNISTSTHT